jgi:dihydrolipoamide dehydrogenase
LLATGSVADNGAFPIDEEVMVSSRGALNFAAVPKTLIVIGGGFVGLEMAMV